MRYRYQVTAVLLALGLALVALGGGAASRAQGATGTISGRVLSLDNVPLAGVPIVAYDRPYTTGDRPVIAQTTTAADGSYTLVVPAGTVWPAISTSVHWGYDYTPVQVAAGANITGIDFVPAVRSLPPSAPTATVVPAPPPTSPPAPPTAEPPPTAAPPPPTAEPPLPPAPTPVPPGMPTTGGGPRGDILWTVAGLALILAGLVLRHPRRAR